MRAELHASHTWVDAEPTYGLEKLHEPELSHTYSPCSAG